MEYLLNIKQRGMEYLLIKGKSQTMKQVCGKNT